MEPQLIVRFFIHGLLLLAPDPPPEDATGTQVERLYVLLPDAREAGTDIGEHFPMLVYCGEKDGDPCGEAKREILAEDEPFENLEITWKKNPRSPRKVAVSDSAGKPPMRQFPSALGQGEDLDWVASISEVLGEPIPLKSSCREESFLKDECPIVARFVFTEGDSKTCGFVHGKPRTMDGSVMDSEVLVPAAKFVAPGAPVYRALANIIEVKLSQPLSQVEALVITRSEGTDFTVGPESSVPDTCPSSDDYCADLAITNTPEQSEWGAEGKHFRELYDLVEIPSDLLTRPYPMILWGADHRPRSKVHAECGMPRKFYEIGGFEIVPTSSSKGDRESLVYIENRPICPPGTP